MAVSDRDIIFDGNYKNMKYEIETYKGQLIEYDDNYDKFMCDISIEDKWKKAKRSSLADIRKEIDQFIKINAEFKPFKCFMVESWDDSDFKEISVTGIRTDGKFINHTMTNENYKSHANKKDTAKWREYDAEIIAAKRALEKEKDAAYSKYSKGVKALAAKLKPIDLSKYDHIINQDEEK